MGMLPMLLMLPWSMPGIVAPAFSTITVAVTCPAFANCERDREVVTLLERLLQAHQHDVVAAWRECHGLAGFLFWQRPDRPHLGHAVIVNALMQCGFGSDRRCDAGQHVSRACACDGQVDHALMPSHCGARPDMIDVDAPLIGEGGKRRNY